MLTVEVYQGRPGLEAVAGDWQRLLENLGHRRFFHSLGWWKSCLNALDDDLGQVSFFVVKRAGQAVAIFPLQCQVRSCCGLSVRQWALPAHMHMPLNDILCDPGTAITEAVAALSRALREDTFGGWDVLNFTEVLAESMLARQVINARGGLAALKQTKTCDSLPCTGSYEEMTAQFSNNFRSNLNKARNKLARNKDVEFRSTTDQPALNSAFQDFLNIEASGWKGAKGTGTAIKLHPELVSFYQSLIDELSPTREVMINSLLVGGKTIASQFCVKDRDTLYVLKLAYDEEWSRVAPGNMLLEQVIMKGIQDRHFRYINLVGNPPWFKAWRPEGTAVYTLWLFNLTPAGLALCGIAKMKQWLRPYYYKYLKREQLPAKAPHAGDRVSNRRPLHGY